jgi:selenocysteine lyase/cysteine desulfurase
MLAEAGLDTRATTDHVHRLQRSFFARARLPGLDALNPNHSRPCAKFLAFSGSDIPAITRELAARHIDVDGREGLLRIGFSLYHDESDVRVLAQALEAASH